MRKPLRIIQSLEEVTEPKNIYDIDEARWLRKFKDEQPECILLAYNEDTDPSAPYFRAHLTPRGKQYLKQLRKEYIGEVSGLPAAV